MAVRPATITGVGITPPQLTYDNLLQMLLRDIQAGLDLSSIPTGSVYFSETQPTAPGPWIWFKLDSTGVIIDILIEDAT